MEHLNFCNTIEELGIRISPARKIGSERRVEIRSLSRSNAIIVNNNKLRWENPDNRDALTSLLIYAIDMDSWKHSWHIDVGDKENLPKIKELIQEKIISRSKDLALLWDVYFLANIPDEQGDNNIKLKN